MARKGRSTRRISRATAQAAQAPAPPKKDDDKLVGPTPEQEQRGKFEKKAHTSEMGQRVGFGYRRLPLFETMATDQRHDISRDELSALRFYRTAHDRSDRSATRSCLAVGAGGGQRGSSEATVMSDVPSIVAARQKVRLCEQALGSTLATIRAVVLDDRSFSDIAMERYGTRKREGTIRQVPTMYRGKPLVIDGKPITRTVYSEKIQPRSGRHREIVRREFLLGLKLLADRVRSLVSTAGDEEVWIQPGSAGARIERGACAPNGLYRMWGKSGAVDAVMRDLRTEHGDELAFATPEAAKAALEAAGTNLSRLGEEELKV
jgi:hypothetical protein